MTLRNNLSNNKLQSNRTMENEELMKKFAAEAKQRWGNTLAYKQSTARVAKMSKEDMARVQTEGDELMKEIVANMSRGPKSPEVQKLIARHYANLRRFYEPSLEMYRGLAEMYVSDPRFTAHYEKYAPGLAKFMRDAMIVYCDKQKK